MTCVLLTSSKHNLSKDTSAVKKGLTSSLPDSVENPNHRCFFFPQSLPSNRLLGVEMVLIGQGWCSFTLALDSSTVITVIKEPLICTTLAASLVLDLGLGAYWRIVIWG